MAATHLSSPFGHRTRHVHELVASRLAGGACHGRAAKGDKLHFSSSLSTNARLVGLDDDGKGVLHLGVEVGAI